GLVAISLVQPFRVRFGTTRAQPVPAARDTSGRARGAPYRGPRAVALRLLLCGLLGVWTATPRAQQGEPQRSQIFRSGTELVLVTVVVRDTTGAVVRGLTRDDFAVTEDDKPQTITSFDFEELDAPSQAQEASVTAPEALLTPPVRPAGTRQAPLTGEPV